MKRVLIVEGNRDFHESYKVVLDTDKLLLGFRTSAVEAIDDVRSTGYDLIILDILMDGHGFNGIGFIWRLRKQLSSRIPVILTTVLDKEICKGIAHLGPFSFLHKPFTADRLLQEVEKYLPA